MKSKIASCFKRKSTPQRYIVKSLNITVRFLNKIIKSDLKLIKTKRHDVHRLTPKHIPQLKTVYKLLYKNYLASEKWKNIATVDEA